MQRRPLMIPQKRTNDRMLGQSSNAAGQKNSVNLTNLPFISTRGLLIIVVVILLSILWLSEFKVFGNGGFGDLLEKKKLSHLDSHRNERLGDSNKDAAALKKTPTSCLEERGYSGKWVRDWEYANQTYYDIHNPTSVYEPTKEAPFKWEISWRWEDDTCDMHVITRESLCRVCQELNLTRIFVGGDSLSELFHVSLLGLIGDPRKFTEHHGVIKINCSTIDHNLSLLFGRFDKSPYSPKKFLQNLNETWLQPDFKPFLTQNPKGTAVIVNVGAHLGADANANGLRGFYETIPLLFDWITESVHPERDIVFFRNTVPGHPMCEPMHKVTTEEYRKGFRITPFTSYKEWETWFHAMMADERSSMYQKYGYQWFEYFNSYSKLLLANYSMPIHWVNVWNMTVLRRDGHMGLANGFFQDCLHYWAPGPTDWWVHMWFSQLNDLAAIRQQQPQSSKAHQ